MALVLAIDPEFAHHDELQQLAGDRAGHEIVFAPSYDEALTIVSRQIPDLIVFPIACSADEEALLASRIGALADSSDPHTIAIALSASASGKSSAMPVRWFYWFKRRDEGRPANGHSAEFAERIRVFLDSARARAGDHEPSDISPAESDSVAQRIVAVVSAKRWRWPLAAAGVLAATVSIAAGLTRGGGWFAKAAEPARAVREQRSASAKPAAPAIQKSATGRTGRLRVISEPTGASVIVDGENRGLTPLLFDDVRVGRHDVTIQSRGGVVRHTVTVKADETASLEVSVFSGWLAFFAPIELEIVAGGRVLQFDDQHRTMLPSGRHEIQFANRELGFHGLRTVDVRPGKVTTVSIVPPKTKLTIIASEVADVWLDGTFVGRTPLVDLPVDLGTHEIVVRHPQRGEQRRTIAATAKPARVEITFVP